jgi:hypothetical protein
MDDKRTLPATASASRAVGLQTPVIVCKTAASVEKRLHIHSSKCAEAVFLPAKAFLSKIGSAWIQCFSSPSGST